MRNGKIRLSQQLLALVGIAFVLLFTSLGVVLPQILIPFAESNIYNYLPNLNGNYSFVSKKIYYEKKDDNYFKYYVYGYIEQDLIDCGLKKNENENSSN